MNTSDTLSVLNITAERFNEVQHDSGVAFLRHYIGDHGDNLVDQTLKTSFYWAWWSNQFEISTAEYLELDTNPTESRWIAWHSPDRVVAKPWKKAIDKGFDLMIESAKHKIEKT